MPPNPSNTQRKYQAIRKRYNELKSIKVNGVQKYTSAYIISVVAEQFFLNASTVENIVWSKCDPVERG
ncbi:MAG: hypothetical protein U0T77_10660 [Chitinophagales bacterium]